MKLRPFELTLVTIFGVLALGAILLLTMYKPDSKSVNSDPSSLGGPVEIWGTVAKEGVSEIISVIAKKNSDYKNVSYKYIQPADFDAVLTNALADGLGPDVILASHEQLVDQRRRIQPVSYESFPLRDIQTQYIDGAAIFALSDGLYGFPIMVDPLMMYWNKAILTNQGYLSPPKTWEELVNDQLPSLIQRSFNRTINRSVVAMGEYNNIRNAFATLSLLLIQSGSQGVTEVDGVYKINIQSTAVDSTNPFRSSVDFFLRFSKPSNALYSWNRSFSEDRVQFISEELVLYFGFGSEGKEIERLNPNLSFDIAEVPQGATASSRRTYGKFYAASALKSSDNLQGAFKVVSMLGGADVSNSIANSYNMVPVHRSIVAGGSNDIYGRFAYQSASVAYGWLNPNRAATDEIFTTLTRDVNENRSSLSIAIIDAISRLKNEYE